MGMGEPLANYDNLLKALRILNAPWGGGIGARKITISTSGLAPQIRRLAEEPLQFRLAISLHGARDEIRNKIMPVNRKYPLGELISACEKVAATLRREKGLDIDAACGQLRLKTERELAGTGKGRPDAGLEPLVQGQVEKPAFHR
jgi:adenine C2-methylase RlmN of 23S rRNA A2503 and tRNA A37